jgi:uncharacterized membrane protein YGL010W
VKTIQEHLTQYAAYHRDRRNIATHFVGVPMIVFSVVLALAVVAIPLGQFTITLAVVGAIAATIYYCRLDIAIGATMAIVFFVMCALASEILARYSDLAVLGWALAIFVVGWIIQFVGHKFEGMKPAFFDDVMGLMIGPIFVVAEFAFVMGLRNDLRGYIEARVGPVVDRRAARSA